MKELYEESIKRITWNMKVSYDEESIKRITWNRKVSNDEEYNFVQKFVSHSVAGPNN